ncbi:MAG: hypothetical protein ACRD36_02250, partial [Candidatus Acidiferrum sp.]
GLQDNGSWCGPSMSLTRDGITNQDWTLMPGGDGFYAEIDNVEPWVVYTESQDGHISRRDAHTGQQREIMPEAKFGEPHYRFQWNSPMAVSAHDHKSIYYGGNYLFKSTDRGDSWTRLGGDLTTGVDRNKLEIFGKVPDKNTLSRHDGVEEYPTITTLSESPVSADVLWVGTDDGNLQVTRDGGKNWKNVASRAPGVPKGTYVSRVLASKYAEGTAYATFDGHRSDDYNVYIFATTDFGETWKAIRKGIPDSAGTVHVVREHPRDANLLFAGTEFGLWVSWDRGADWTALKNNLPTVPVDDIEIQAEQNDLVLATHGRSIWILDDITPLEKFDANVADSAMTFFKPRTATLWDLRQRRWSAGQKMFTAKNPPYGAILSYYLKEAVPPKAPKTAKDDKDKNKEKKEAAAEDQKSKTDGAEKKEGKAKISVYDAAGKLVREFDGPGKAGVNRTNWDLRWDSPAVPTPEQLQAAAAGFDFGPRGPLAEPGEYTIKIKAGSQEATQKVLVEDDPRMQMSAADRAARREAIDQLYALAKTADKDRKTIEGIKTGLKAARDEWKKNAGKPDMPKIPEEIVKAADELQKKVDAVAEKYVHEREGLGNAGPPFVWKPAPLPNQVQGLLRDMDGFWAAPGGQQKDKLAELTPLISDASTQVKKIAEEDLPALNKKMNEAGVPHIIPVQPQQTGRGGYEEESEP